MTIRWRIAISVVSLAASRVAASPCDVSGPAEPLETILQHIADKLVAAGVDVKAVCQASKPGAARCTSLPSLKSPAPDAHRIVETALRSGALAEQLVVAAMQLDELAATDPTRQDKLAAAATALRGEAVGMTTPWRMVVSATHSERIAVAVRLANPPTTRMRVAFDAERTSSHFELVWDPAVATPLVQRLELPTGVWIVTPTTEPILLQQGDGSLVIATKFDGLHGAPGVITTTGTQTALVAVGKGALDAARQVAMTGWPQPTLALTCDAPARVAMGDVAFALQLAARASAQRSLATAPTVVTETLSLLAEIAVERAKRGAFELVKARLVDPLCVDADDRITLHRLRLGKSDDLAFPRTCQLLVALRLEDVLTTGDALLHALRDDGRTTIAPAIVHQLGQAAPGIEPVLDAVLQIVNRAIDRGRFEVLDAESLLELMGDANVLGGALAAVPLPVSATIGDRLAALLAQERTIAATVCKGVAVAACVDALVASRHGPAEWIAWLDRIYPSLSLASRDRLSDVVGGKLQPLLARFQTQLKDLLAAHSEIHAAVCGALTADACITNWLATATTVGHLGRLLSVSLTADQHKQLESVVLPVLRAIVGATPRLDTALGTACGARLVITAVKHCAGASCSAAQISDLLTHPRDYFAPDTQLPAALCWDGETYVAPPAALASLQRLVIDGLELVEQVRDATGRERAVAAIQLAVAVIERIHGEHDERFAALGEFAVALAREQYDAALPTLLRLADRTLAAERLPLPPGLHKLATLVGGVAAYASVYQATKSEDAKAAREARKQALESMIDSATDRKQRERDWVVSLGSNVGASIARANVFAQDDDRLFTGRARPPWQAGVRVPFGLAFQYLPGAWSAHDSSAGKLLSIVGVHAALDLADLGQLIRSDPGADAAWSSFVAPGIELGFLIGTPSHALSVTTHAAFAPGLSDPIAPSHAEWRYGISLGYYVPFFDLN